MTAPLPPIQRIAAEGPLVDILAGASRLEVKIHDHGFIALIDAMPRLVPAGQTADGAIVQAARVSYGQGTKKVSEDRGLIRYLLRHRHTTPFEMLEFKFHIAMPIFVARQWIRHRTANVNEYSGRYSIMPDQFYKPTLENVRKQSTSNRQGGAEKFITTSDSASPDANPKSKIQNPKSDTSDDPATAESFLAFLDRTEGEYAEYLRLTEKGVSRELARIGLPQSIYTQWYWKCDLHNILRFLSLRMDAHAQEEIRVYAEAMYALLEPIVPIAMEAWRDYELEAVHLTRLEIDALREGSADLKSDNKREQAEWDQKRQRLGIKEAVISTGLDHIPSWYRSRQPGTFAGSAGGCLPSDPRLIIVANRLPVHRVGTGAGSRWQSSAGGLVTALAPVLRRTRGAWVGWTGTAGAAPPSFQHEGLRIKPVPLTPTDVEYYYHGLSNRTLWPLYHDAIRTPEFKRQWWWPYVDANQRFARAAAALARHRDLVWVHDYHLQLVPRILRELRPDLRIGFFLHTPFPPEEIFAWLPWRRQVLEGLMGADAVGFQTASSARNFSRAARAFTEAEGTDTRLEFGGRQVRVNAFPISIDTAWFEENAASPSVEKAALDIRRKIGSHRKILLGVDRLDYTKGIDARLQAFELLLRQKAVSVERCVLMQIAVPSRELVGEYAETRKTIEHMVGRINGDHSIPGRVAVHYFRRGYSREDLIPYYRAADVMLVTPLRDGMNLVAKEYVATRIDNTGVLVLSEFAGAAQEFRRSLLVNPRDLDGTAATMHAAMTLPKDEARQRMSILRTIVRRHTVHDWAESFLEALRS